VTPVVVATGPQEGAELAADALLAAGASAVAEEDLGGGRVRLTSDGGVPGALPDGWTLQEREVDAGAALDAWRAHAVPVRAGQRIVLQPPWTPPLEVSDRDVVIELDPGRAFGSGSHPSTRLVLAALEEVITGGEHVLDIGCGSGVLAVAALRLGASDAVAVDVDARAVEATRRVADRNGVGDRLEVSSTPIGDVPGRFEVVTANIGARFLVEAAGDVSARAGPSGALLLAGFLADRADAVRRAYATFDEEGRLTEEGWTVLRLRRRLSPATCG
jgi:ribosomal protein L11 methyltransferase